MRNIHKGSGKHVLYCVNTDVKIVKFKQSWTPGIQLQLTCKARAQRVTFHMLSCTAEQAVPLSFLPCSKRMLRTKFGVWDIVGALHASHLSATNGTWLQQRSDLVSPLRSLLSDFLQLVLQIFTWAQDSCRVECQYQLVDVFVFCQLHLKMFFTYLWMSKPNPICGMIRYNEICKGLRTFYASGWVKILSMTKLPQHER